ncbi:kelch repeat and BTB domain-containing protein 3-like [Amphiura filiformis]|uniref:kelch repeat and BTB domain-containing protein 3-like n=1 Tax=Amphiura filiformis TaxID=82378 RepID=UPI003B212D55
MAANTAHLIELTSVLNDLRSKAALHDFTIIIGGKRRGKKFPTHRVILAAASDYFNTLFLSEHFKENDKDEVVLKHTDCSSPDVFEIVLEFIYTGKSDGVTKENCFDVLAAACYLQIKYLIKECSKFICKSYKGDNLAFENPLRIFNMACNYGLPDLKTLGLTLMARDFKELAQTDDFLVYMTSGLFSDLLERKDLAVPSEKMLLDAVLEWLQHSWNSRKKHAWPLLQKVRLGLIPMEDVRKYQRDNLSEIVEFSRVYYELLEYHTLKQMEPEQRKGPLLRAMQDAFIPRDTVKAPVMIHSSTYPSRVHYFGTRAGTLTSIKFDADGVPDATDATLHVVQDELYIVGGNAGRMQKFIRINPGMKSSQELPRLKQGRRNAAVVYHQGYLYAIGGDVKKDPKGTPVFTASAERYDFQRMVWQGIADLPCTLRDPHAIVFNNKIVVCGVEVGARVGDQDMARVKVFDPDTNQWARLLDGKCAEMGQYWLSNSGEPNCLYLIMTRKDTSIGKYSTTVFEYRQISQDHTTSIKLGSSTNVDQSLLGQSKLPAFRIGSDVYLIVRNYIYKTGVKIEDDQIYETDLSKWDVLLTNAGGDKFTEFIIRV